MVTEEQALLFAEGILGSSLTIVRRIGYGSSGAFVFLLQDDKLRFYAVKCGSQLRVSLKTQLANRSHLEPYMPYNIAQILGYQCCNTFDEYALFDSPSIYSLLEIASRVQIREHAEVIWDGVVDCITRLWKTTAESYIPSKNPRPQETRINRVTSGVINVIGNIDRSVFINQIKYPSIRELLIEVTNVSLPDYGVVCHGDPTPSNVIPSTNSNNWVMVDWEWTGPQQDWRMLTAQMYGTWIQHNSSVSPISISRFARFLDDRIEIDLESAIQIPNWISAFQQRVTRNFQGLSNQDITDINRYLATLYIGEVRYCEARNRAAMIPAFVALSLLTAFDNYKSKSLGNFTGLV